MDIRLERTPLESIASDAAIILAFEGKKDDRLGLAQWFDSGEIAGKPLEMTLLHQVAGLKAARLLVLGVGKAEKFTPADMRKAAGAALRYLKGRSIQRISMYLEEGSASPPFAAAAVEGAILGDYEPDRHKSEKNGKKPVESFSVCVSGDAAGLDEAVRRARIVAESQNFSRELVNEPGNLLTPTVLAERAREMAVEQGLGCEILDQDRMKQLGMGSLLGVAQGSAEPPALIVLRYQPSQAAGKAHLGLVGKGVTFDTGGISIKPAESMEKMKYDMAGGATMIGAMRAIAQLKPAIPVTALIPAVENMPSDRAQRPGDIVTALSGKTIEVINTDAEGRLILADALTYARRLGCTHLVDAATLTGAVVVALGHIRAGLFTNDNGLRDRVLAASEAEGERMWHMPLDDDYKDYLKSPFADLANVGGRWGGAVTAAYFLKEFAEDTPWVHLDIAGTAWIDDNKPFISKGPSGIGVRSLVHLALNWKD